MRLYNIVKQLLETDPPLRDSDKKLLWEVWRHQGFVKNWQLSFADFMNSRLVTPESITRVRRKLQEKFPHLCGTLPVTTRRRKKALTKGTFIYREPIQYRFENGVAIPTN